MSAVYRALLLVPLLASAFALPATADSIEVSGLPGEPIAGNGTAATLPFQVVVSLDRGSCAGGTSSAFTVTLQADLEGAYGPGVSASVNPSSLLVEVGPADTVSAGRSYTYDATLIVQAIGLEDATDAVAHVTASVGAISCRVALASAGPFDPAVGNATIRFSPSSVPVTQGPTDEPVPGLALPLVAVAAVAAAWLRRR